jgi:1-acyl-sn-glycerol-3-phosphate acyltransferase
MRVMDGRSAAARPRGLLGTPSARATRTYRWLLRACDLIRGSIFAIRIDVIGLDRLPKDPTGRPAGGWIAAGAPHRTWIDPFVVALALPLEPRLTYFGDGRAIFRSRWRRFVFGRIGGVIPIWPGGGRSAVEAHIAGASSALDARAVLCLFPESGPAVPVGTARPFGLGIGYFALRSGAPLVPLALAGTEDLYRGRRVRLEILEPVTWQALIGEPQGSTPPAPWSPAERGTARRIVVALHERMSSAVASGHEATVVPPDVRRRWRWLTTAWH